jgi:hypothetical protein
VQIELVKIRSVLSPVKATASHLLSSPIGFSTGTSTLSKKTWWLLSGWFITVRIGVHDNPGESASTMNTDSRAHCARRRWCARPPSLSPLTPYR